MQNPFAKLVPQYFGEYPKPFQKLYNSVSLGPDQNKEEECFAPHICFSKLAALHFDKQNRGGVRSTLLFFEFQEFNNVSRNPHQIDMSLKFIIRNKLKNAFLMQDPGTKSQTAIGSRGEIQKRQKTAGLNVKM